MIGKPLSQRFAARDRDRSRRIIMHCAACGESTPVEINSPGVNGVTIQHENDCPFWRAIETEHAEKWLLENGYPISIGLPMGDA